ncbi:uncharacterized protein LOC134276461, partial [Saccostrea cucullata]|uniref:uncharacterized protein LOC134276461 n=1 Tax=Saccostrea cuccullata TaxID=36930 RepID=UPI002ED6653A
MIVGCAGAGKTTLLARLQKKSMEEIQNIESTVGLNVHNDIFEVLEKEGKLEVAMHKCDPAIHIKENVPIDDAEKIEEKKLLSILDFGGQCMYYACHQIYLSKRAFYILVVDMSKKLEDVIDEELCDQKDTMFSKWSHRDYLLFWLKSVNCYCGSAAPVILVATHAEGKSEQVYIYPFLKKKETKLQELDKLKESFDKLLPLSRREFKDLLRFYHDIGVILYFPSEEPMRNEDSHFHFCPEIVILDIQWFVNSFKYVMTDSKQDSFNKVVDAAPTTEALDTFTTTGEISGAFLKAIWTATKNQTAVEYKDEMLNYMERLGLMAIEEKSDICFIPSMNRMTVQEHVKSKINSHPNKSPTLYFEFPVLPVFLFYRLIVLCLKKGWEPLMDGRKCIFIDTAMFYYKEYVLVLGVSESYIQLMLYNDNHTRDGSIQTALRNITEMRMLYSLQQAFDYQMQEISMNMAFINVKREVMEMLSSLTKTFNIDLHYKVGLSCTPTEFGKELDNTFITEDNLFKYNGRKCPLHAYAKDHDVEDLRRFL